MDWQTAQNIVRELHEIEGSFFFIGVAISALAIVHFLHLFKD